MKKTVAAVLAAVLLALLLAGCGGSAETASVQSVSMICGLGPVGLSNRFSGMVSAGEETRIEKDESFKVAELKVAVGDTVKAGDVLFSYDTEAGQLDLEKAKLTLEQQQASLANLKTQKEDLEKQKARASGNLELELSLEIRDVETQITEAEYNLKSKENEIAKLEVSLQNATVTAPVSGRIQSINENGGYDDRGNPLPYISIVSNEGFLVKAYVNETNMASVMEGTPVVLLARVGDGRWTGVVTKVDLENPAQNNNYYSDETTMSSRYPFYVTLDSSEGLMLGQHLYVEPGFGIEEEDEGPEIRLASGYICDAEGSPWVWARSSAGKLEKRKVTLGDYEEFSDSYLIVSGLAAADYIAWPDENLKAGMDCVTYSESDFSGNAGNEGEAVFNGTGIYEEGFEEDFVEESFEGGFADDAAEDYVEPVPATGSFEGGEG